MATLLLGPPLGAALEPTHGSFRFLREWAGEARPEPTEHARYLLALCMPIVGAAAIASAPRWLSRVPARVVTPVVLFAQAALAMTVVACIVAQPQLRFTIPVGHGSYRLGERYFTPTTYAFAALAAAAAFAALRSPAIRGWGIHLLRESRPIAVIGGVGAVGMTAIWLLHTINSDASIATALDEVRYHLGFALDETFAVINGRTPLVDFSAQYGSLLPYVIAVPMLAFGKGLLTFTIALGALTAAGLLAVYDVFRRVARSSAAAFALYLPFLASSMFLVGGTLANRSSVGTYTGAFPLRYAAPLLLMWLTARRIDRRGNDLSGTWSLFVFAGLVAVNSSDFGVVAFAATLGALAAVTPAAHRRSALLRLVAAAATGLAIAASVVSLLTLLRAGALPQPARLFDYARTYTIGGFALIRIPSVIGIHLLLYLTYVGALSAATVRAARGARNLVLTGMLAWSGAFGLGAGMYWVGRSHPVSLKYHFSAWALALMLLAVPAARELASARLRATAVSAGIVLFGVGVMTCSIAQTPLPWQQLARLRSPFVASAERPVPERLDASSDPTTRTFVASLAQGLSRFVTRPGVPVAILLTTGHRIADAYRVVDVSPYTGVDSLGTVERVEAVLDALQAAGGNTVILPIPLDTSIFPLLERRGFRLLTAAGPRRYVKGVTEPVVRPWGAGGVIKWIDMRNLHPRALR